MCKVITLIYLLLPLSPPLLQVSEGVFCLRNFAPSSSASSHEKSVTLTDGGRLWLRAWTDTLFGLGLAAAVGAAAHHLTRTCIYSADSSTFIFISFFGFCIGANPILGITPAIFRTWRPRPFCSRQLFLPPSLLMWPQLFPLPSSTSEAFAQCLL